MSIITWKNVAQGGSDAPATNMMKTAVSQFDKTFSNAKGILGDYQELEQKNWQNTKRNNTNKLMDELYNVKSAEELDALRGEGYFKQMRDQMGAQYDTESFRNALDGRGQVLMDRSVAADGYEDHGLRRGQRETEGQIARMISEGNMDGARALADQLEIDQAQAFSGIMEGDMAWRQDNRSERTTQNTLANGEVSRRVSLDGNSRAQQAHDMQVAEQLRRQELGGLVNNVVAQINSGDMSGPAAIQAMVTEMEQRNASPQDIQVAIQDVQGIVSGQLQATEMDNRWESGELEKINNHFSGIESNPIFVASNDNRNKADQLNEVVDRGRELGLVGKNGSFFSSEQTLQRQANEMLSQNFEFRDRAGNRHNVPVNSNMINAALQARHNGSIMPGMGFKNPRTLNALMQNYLSSMPTEQYLADVQAYGDAMSAFQEEAKEYYQKK